MFVTMIVNVIGKADGPTSIFLDNNNGPAWINIFGLIIVVLMLLPNILYAAKHQNIKNECKNKAMNFIEQIAFVILR
jgi:Na+-transporting methylmalonyl-CoA/oxaloacetate decarboxylase beta subunit